MKPFMFLLLATFLRGKLGKQIAHCVFWCDVFINE